MARGERSRDLAIGPWRIRFEGLDAPLDDALQRRWGAFWGAPVTAAHLSVEVTRGDGGTWIPTGGPGEHYRLEAEADADGVFAASYRFALAPRSKTSWRLALEETSDEPLDRVMDNATRYLVARLATEGGGLALHGAGVARDGRAWVFAGPSRSGKSTAVRNSNGTSLGDDFALLLPGVGGWVVPAVPFDNAEAGDVAPSPPWPLASVLRLHQAPAPKLERPTGARAHAGLMACLAFPWALSDLAGRIDEAIGSVVAGGLFSELWLAPEPSFWSLLEEP